MLQKYGLSAMAGCIILRLGGEKSTKGKMWTHFPFRKVKNIGIKRLLLDLHHLIVVNSAAVLTDVQPNGPDGTRVSGEAHGIILL